MSGQTNFIDPALYEELLIHIRKAAETSGISLPKLWVAREYMVSDSSGGRYTTVVKTGAYIPDSRLAAVKQKVRAEFEEQHPFHPSKWEFFSPGKPRRVDFFM